jgi:hypothetical protein
MSNPTPPPPDALTAATQMVKNGRLDQARETLTQYLMHNPSSEQAWLLMSYVLPDPAKQKDCLERVLRINPNNTVAQSKLAHLLGRRTEELFKRKPAPPPPPVVPEAEPEAESQPEPVPEPEPELFSPPENRFDKEPEPRAKPVQKPAPPPPPPIPVPAVSKAPAEERSAPAAEPPAPISARALEGKKPLFSGTWFRIITLVLIGIIVVLVGVILYINIIGPAVNAMNSTATPTTEPVIVPTFPPEWTRTLTPTITETVPASDTPFPSQTFTPIETIIQ